MDMITVFFFGKLSETYFYCSMRTYLSFSELFLGFFRGLNGWQDYSATVFWKLSSGHGVTTGSEMRSERKPGR